MTRVVSGDSVRLSAVTYSDRGSLKSPGFISTWEGNPRSPSALGIIVNYTGGYAGESLRDATAIPGAQAPYFGQASGKDVERLLSDFEKIWPGFCCTARLNPVGAVRLQCRCGGSINVHSTLRGFAGNFACVRAKKCPRPARCAGLQDHGE